MDWIIFIVLYRYYLVMIWLIIVLEGALKELLFVVGRFIYALHIA